jgi:hypothetical protein
MLLTRLLIPVGYLAFEQIRGWIRRLFGQSPPGRTA